MKQLRVDAPTVSAGAPIARLTRLNTLLGMLLGAALASLLAACTPQAGTQSPANREQRAYTGPLREPNVYRANFQWRQRITARWPKGTHSFDAVVEKFDNELQLLGLNPMGMPGFVIRLRGSEITVENHTDQKLPFDPRYILLDVERVFFPWFEEPPPASGTRQRTLEGESITETWQGNQLQQREFRRVDGAEQGTISVRYSGWKAGLAGPSHAQLDNGWFGYSLGIETLEQQLLPDAPP